MRGKVFNALQVNLSSKPNNEVAHTSTDDCVVFGCGDTAGTSVFGSSSHLLTPFILTHYLPSTHRV